MDKVNQDVRQEIAKAKKQGVKQWMIAEKYGLHEGNFCRLLRKELPDAVKQKIFNIINSLLEELNNK